MTDDEDILADLLIRWEELHEQGQEISAIELCQLHPHLTDELESRIKALLGTSWLNRPVEDLDADDFSTLQYEPRTLVDRYRLDELVAEGGFAQVWRAYDLELHRFVAVKLPKPSRLASADAFMAEARRVARLKHPGIVPVHDIGRIGDTCFIVSEFIEGGNLASHLLSKSIPTTLATRWAVDITEALEYAHKSGIIHRDIKPANILIDHHGRALLADFGIAQSANKTGVFAPSIGTLRYMSPEQLAGKEALVQSDIYSMGVVLHELLTGSIPYLSDVPTVLRNEIVSGAKVASNNLPVDLRSICTKALELDPKNRYAIAAQMATDLRMTLDGPKGKWTFLSSILGLVLIGAAFAFWWTNPSPSNAKPALKKIETDWFTRVAKLSNDDQIYEVIAKLKELNPGFDGQMVHEVTDGSIDLIEMRTDHVTDIRPLAVFKALEFLNLSGTFTWKHNGKLVDITPLKGLPLKELDIHSTLVDDLKPVAEAPLTVLVANNTQVVDLSPIRNAKLIRLDLHNTYVADLSPLKGMRLTNLHIANTQVKDLSPLTGMPIDDLRCQYAGFSDITPLKGMPLVSLECHGNPITDLSPLLGSPVMHLNIYKTKIVDWSPLKTMPRLKMIGLDFDKARDSEILREVTTLQEINQQSSRDFWRANEQIELSKNKTNLGDFEAMQGEWLCVSTEDGRFSSEEVIALHDRRAKIQGSSFSMSRTNDGIRGTYSGAITIHDDKKYFDFSGVGPQGKPVKMIGIYRISGDVFKICFRFQYVFETKAPPRPTEIKQDGLEPNAHVYIFHRVNFHKEAGK